jgi:hypothetical protein
MERATQIFFGKEKILKSDFISLIQSVTPRFMSRFSGLKPLSNSRKADLLAWLEEQRGRIELLLPHLIEEEEQEN